MTATSQVAVGILGNTGNGVFVHPVVGLRMHPVPCKEYETMETIVKPEDNLGRKKTLKQISDGIWEYCKRVHTTGRWYQGAVEKDIITWQF